jgi:predicted transcriptional regulator
MDILEQVRSDLKGAPMVRQEEVAQATGIPWSTLRKIVDGDTENPRYDTVERLRKYYAQSRPQ